MTTLLGTHNVANFGPRTAPVRDKYWAERGLIHLENTITNEYKLLSLRTFLHRLNAISNMISRARTELAKSNFAHSDEIKRQMQFVEKATIIAQQAREQGMPTDPDARKEAKRRAPKSVVVPDRKYSF